MILQTTYYMYDMIYYNYNYNLDIKYGSLTLTLTVSYGCAVQYTVPQ